MFSPALKFASTFLYFAVDNSGTLKYPAIQVSNATVHAVYHCISLNVNSSWRINLAVSCYKNRLFYKELRSFLMKGGVNRESVKNLSIP